MKVFRFQKSMCGVLLCVPHAGTFIPPEIAGSMTPAGLDSRGNWFLIEKIQQLERPEFGLIASNISRHVLDLDQVGDAEKVCPAMTPGGDEIYQPEKLPTSKQISQRVEHYGQPFHDQLASEITRMVDAFGEATVVIVVNEDLVDADAVGRSAIAATIERARNGVEGKLEIKRLALSPETDMASVRDAGF